jgi:hypothetical protein
MATAINTSNNFFIKIRIAAKTEGELKASVC